MKTQSQFPFRKLTPKRAKLLNFYNRKDSVAKLALPPRIWVSHCIEMDQWRHNGLPVGAHGAESSPAEYRRYML